ncbi:RNA deprotection pyrophosphohydrolase [Oceanobacillus manasiensis]|uniref:RNA deprotection pyrophosphohydrolase n=1 Tax=Oceanobacillus manasiensis TaxID=586413 RepID=UPI0005AB8284|nr:nucleoside triphosphatase YtkD [Oceanobacillus manasiensis]
MFTFKDYYNNKVKLSFLNQPFSNDPRHVWVICKYRDKWLLTKHKERGLEFPGGKVEIGETAEQAAEREVMEETGGTIKDLYYIGQYYVYGKREHVAKNVYFAIVDSLLPQKDYYETEGPKLLNAMPPNIKQSKAFSFIMKDDVLYRCIERINVTL